MSYRRDSSEEYKRMVHDAYEIPLIWSVWSSIGTWLLLTGYLLVPSGYGALQRSQALHDAGQFGRFVQSASYNIPVVVVASTTCFVAVGLLYFVWSRRAGNLIWTSNQIFTYVPGTPVRLYVC
jgi:hypothetical protein